jgi:ankyrin repeat protein
MTDVFFAPSQGKKIAHLPWQPAIKYISRSPSIQRNLERPLPTWERNERKKYRNVPAQAKVVNPEKEILKAAKSGAVTKIKKLLDHDATLISARDADGSTPLHCATWKGHLNVVVLPLKCGADVNARNNEHGGTTPLRAAAHANQPALAELLIAHGADIHAVNLNGRTPLAETEFHKAKPVANLLKQHGATA